VPIALGRHGDLGNSATLRLPPRHPRHGMHQLPVG
jgi:hypothetical protein